jgi:hypothetical protein
MPIHRLEDDPEHPVEVEVSAAVAAVLAAPEPPLKEVTFTDLGRRRPRGARAIRPEDVPDPKSQAREDGNPREGPYFRFSLLLGESTTWRGPEHTPDFCGGRELQPYELCLWCQRTGRDGDIPSPTDNDMQKRGRRRTYAKGKLKGGKN